MPSTMENANHGLAQRNIKSAINRVSAQRNRFADPILGIGLELYLTCKHRLRGLIRGVITDEVLKSRSN